MSKKAANYKGNALRTNHCGAGDGTASSNPARCTIESHKLSSAKGWEGAGVFFVMELLEVKLWRMIICACNASLT